MSIKLKGLARTTGQIPVNQGDAVDMAMDDLGRPIVTPYQARDLIVTAYLTVTTGTRTVLLTGDADHFHDLLEISCATDSTVTSTNLLIVDDGTTVRGLDIPIADTVQLKFPAPLPQSAKGGNWYVDMEDVTGTTLQIGALFMKHK